MQYLDLIELLPTAHFVPQIDLTSWFRVEENNSMAQSRSFAIGPSLWNAISPSVRSMFSVLHLSQNLSLLIGSNQWQQLRHCLHSDSASPKPGKRRRCDTNHLCYGTVSLNIKSGAMAALLNGSPH